MANIKFCKRCRDNNQPPFKGYYFTMLDKECCPVKNCGYPLVEINFPADDHKFIYFSISKDIDFLEAMIDLKQKDPIEYQSRMAQFKAQARDREQAKKERWAAEKLPKCSYCGSTNIQVVRKNWSFMRGFATNATERVCANCGRKM